MIFFFFFFFFLSSNLTTMVTPMDELILPPREMKKKRQKRTYMRDGEWVEGGGRGRLNQFYSCETSPLTLKQLEITKFLIYIRSAPGSSASSVTYYSEFT